MSLALQTTLDGYRAAIQAGKREDAVRHLTEAVPAIPRGDDLFRRVCGELAVLLFQLGRFADSEIYARKCLTVDVGNSHQWNVLGLAIKNQGRPADAVPLYERALALDANNNAARLNLGQVYLALDDLERAGKIFADLVTREPTNGEFRRFHGVSLRRLDKVDEAERELAQARALAPDNVMCFTDSAWFYEETGRSDDALRVVMEALGRFGPHPQLVRFRAVLQRRRGQHAEVETWLLGLSKEKPDEVAVWKELGYTAAAFDDAKAAGFFKEALARAPNDPGIITELAFVLQRIRGPEEGRNIAEAYRLALKRIELGGNLAEHTPHLHTILLRCADYDRAEALGNVTDLGTSWSKANRLAALHHLMSQVKTHKDRVDLVDWHRRCGRMFDEHAERSPLPARPAVVGRAKIRVGFMSSDLRDHPVAYFAEPLLRHMNRDRFELYCYSWSTGPVDRIQRSIMDKVDAFRQVPAAGAREAAQLIAGDDLDVLFELGAATHMNKIEVMSWRPAARSVSWLGYPHSIGLSTIDRILVDPYTKPVSPDLMIEKPFEVARSWVSLEAPGFNTVPDIAPTSAEERYKRVTFGTANNPYKFHRELIETWADILARVPGSRFLFVRPESAVPPFRDNMCRIFASRGVAPDRLSFVPVRGAHLPYYNEIDIALDTWPQTGGTTTCEALFMGVPTVSLIGESIYERLSYSNLSNAGVGHLAVDSRAAYLDMAVQLAGDSAWRATFRREIRERIRSLPLGDTRLFTRDFEDAITSWMDDAR